MTLPKKRPSARAKSRVDYSRVPSAHVVPVSLSPGRYEALTLSAKAHNRSLEDEIHLAISQYLTELS